MRNGLQSAFINCSRGSAAEPGDELKGFEQVVKDSWVYEELYQARNVAPAMHRFGMLIGSVFSFIEYGLLRGRLPFTLNDPTPDHECLKPASESKVLEYPKPDGEISFDKLSSVYLSNTYHGEHQPCHLLLKDDSIPINYNLPLYDEQVIFCWGSLISQVLQCTQFWLLI